MTCGGNPVVCNSVVDGQMDGCAQRCLKIEFLLPLPLRPGKLKTTGKKRRESANGDGGGEGL